MTRVERPQSQGETETGQEVAEEATGSGNLRILVVEGEAVSSYAVPEDGELIIGRGAGSHIPVADRRASRRHAVVHARGHALTLEDMGGSNGTRVCGRVLAPRQSVELAVGDVVQIGAAVLLLQAARARRTVVGGERVAARVAELCTAPAETELSIARLAAVDHASEQARAGLDEVLLACLADGDLVARDGPSGYLLLIVAGEEVARRTVRRALDRLRRVGATVRSGTASSPRDGRDADTLLARATLALRSERGFAGERPAVIAGAMTQVYDAAARYAHSHLPLLIVGETGVGKDVMAAFVHQASPRAARPFLCLNCAAIPEALLESELFGHERGAFTGAVAAKPGLLEAAHKGTLFLDEIADLPLAAQAKLLRIFESRQLFRVGSVQPREVDVRFLAATNRDLEAEVAAGRFRRDLYYRLKGVALRIPPLRERRSEIPQLARHFLEEACAQMARRPVPDWSAEAMRRLAEHPWPGNVRELRSVVERAVLLCSGNCIDVTELPEELAPEPEPAGDAPATEDALRAQLRAAERSRLQAALESCGWNQSRAAELLGIARNTLITRMKQHALQRPGRRPPESD